MTADTRTRLGMVGACAAIFVLVVAGPVLVAVLLPWWALFAWTAASVPLGLLVVVALGLRDQHEAVR